MTSTEYATQLLAAIRRTQSRAKDLQVTANALLMRPRSTTLEIDTTVGNRVLYTLSGEVAFDDTQDGLRGAPVNMLIPQDRAFVLTHYPVISWVPSGPSNATNIGHYSPIRTWPTPFPALYPAANIDVVDISYELIDGGTQRNLQDAAVVSGQLVSTGNNLIPLPVPTLFAPNATIYIYPTYHNIYFAPASLDPLTVATTQGTLHVDLPGYCILI